MRWSALWLIGWFTAALVAWFVFGEGVFQHNLPMTLRSPSLAFPAGFDAFGRNLLPLELRASLISVGFSFLAVTIATVISILLGCLLTLSSESVRPACLRVLEGLLAFPTLIIALAWAAIRGPGWSTLFLALFLGMIPDSVRLLTLRGQEILTQDYIEAAVGLGAGRKRIFLKYLAPELTRLSAVKYPALFAQTLIAEATLSFLGVGAPIGQDTWGSLLAQSKDYLIEAPHLAIATGLPLVLTVLALQIIAEDRELQARRGL